MRPYSLSLVLSNGTLTALPPRRGTRSGRAFSTLVVVARFLYQLDFSLRFEDPHRLHAHARKTDRTGQKRASLISLRVPNMSMTSLFSLRSPRQT